MTTEKTADPGQMNAAELEAFIKLKDETHRTEMTALRALLRVRKLGMK